MIAAIFHWIIGAPSPESVERETRRQHLERTLQKFDESHDKVSEVRAGLRQTCTETSALIAESCAATRSRAAVPENAGKNLP